MHEGELTGCSMDTPTYYDLGWYGDEAEGCLEWLIEGYGVDLTGFDFDTYYPPEFEGRSAPAALLCSLLPFVGSWLRNRRSYRPQTLGIIDQLIRFERWSLVAVDDKSAP
jgi:hypothetical protein